MIFSNPTYNGITFSRFVRGSGYQAELVSGDRIQIRSTIDPLPGQSGIQRYIDQYGARLMQLRGAVKGTTETDLYTKINALIQAFDIKQLEANFTYGFAPLDWTDPGQPPARYYLKPINDTLVISEDRTGLARKFSVLLQAKNPTKYNTNQFTYTITVQNTGGNSGFAFGFPVGFSSVSGAAASTIPNGGSAAVFPESITLGGPPSGSWVGPRITNQTTGFFIQFNSSVTLAAGESILIRPALGTAVKILTNGTSVDVTGSLVPSSSFWTLQAGNNTIQIDGSAVSAGSYATIVVNPSF